jgi:hypothetical protein
MNRITAAAQTSRASFTRFLFNEQIEGSARFVEAHPVSLECAQIGKLGVGAAMPTDTSQEHHTAETQTRSLLDKRTIRIQRLEAKLAHLHSRELRGVARLWKEFAIRRIIRALNRCEKP